MKVKFVRQSVQKYDWDCGVAAVAFLLRNKGYKVDYRKLTKDLNASESRGTDLVEIVKFFKKHPDFEAKERNKSNLNWVEQELTLGKVVLVAYQNWQKEKDMGEPDWGHYGVIYKIEKNKVYLFDPGEKDGLTKFGREEFEKRWYEDDLGVHYDKWAMSLAL